MTSLRTFSEKETDENIKFGVKINEFYLRYHYEGKEYKLTTKEFYAIYLVGIND